jgi:hypothetical protein
MQYFTFRWTVAVLFLYSFFSATLSFAQEEQESEEIIVYLQVRNVGGAELPAYIQGEELFLPLTDVFSFLKIQNSPSPGFDSVSGYFLNQQDVFLVEWANNRIHYKQKVLNLEPGDLIQTENNLYLRSKYFGQVFGLNCNFDFRSFSVFLSTDLELPIIREMRQELMRNNINRLRGEMKTDTTIRRNHPFFHFGAADWSVSATQQVQGMSNVRLNLMVGALLAGGEATLNLNYSNTQPIIARQQSWIWHYVNNDLRVLKQVMVGKISSHATSSMIAPVIGVQVTNTPTTFNRSFGTYTITDYTKPGWIVELYVNYELIAYVKADASGYFSFEVPLVYGNSLVKLRFFGPWGEEHTQEQNISIPFNFLPPRKLEYTVSAGFLENQENSRFSRAEFHYGIGRRLTVGAGIEYLSSITSGNTMPFANFSLRLASSLLVSGEYIYGVRSKGVISCRLPSNLMFELYYTNYNRNQKAIMNNYLEERKAVISMPVRIRHFSSLLRLTIDQIILPMSQNFSSSLMISGTISGVSTNLTTFALFSDPVHPYISSDLSLSFRLPAKIIITPQVQYVYTQNRFLSFKLTVEKQVLRNGVLNMTYDRNFLGNTNNFQIGIRYDFPFAQANLSTRYGNDAITLIQYGRGSLLYEGKEGRLAVSNYSSVGKGGIIILPFLDLNNNGRREKDEPKVAGLNLHITGGRIEKSSHDTTIRVSDLEPYNQYFIELDRNSFNNISWRIPKATISITINPNQYKLVEVPVTVVGEASGYVYISEESGQRGLGRITVCFYRSDTILVARMLTESDGYFSLFGLPPGSYTAKLDTHQLYQVHMTVSPGEIPFTILRSKDGDVVDGLEFILQPIQSDIAPIIRTIKEYQVTPAEEIRVTPDQKQKPVPEKPVLHLHENNPPPVPEEKVVPPHEQKSIPTVSPQQPGKLLINVDSSSFYIQVGAFRLQANALAAQTKLSAFIGHPAVILFENGFYKLRITGFVNFSVAANFLQNVIRQGFPGAYIHKNR